MDWYEIEPSFSAHFACTTGMSALPPSLVAGLLFLPYAVECPDEIADNTWVKSPDWHFFICEWHLKIESRIEPSSLTRVRRRLAEEAV